MMMKLWYRKEYNITYKLHIEERYFFLFERVTHRSLSMHRHCRLAIIMWQRFNNVQRVNTAVDQD